MKTKSRQESRSGEPPTPRQLDLYRIILKYYADHGHAPTILAVARLDGKDNPTSIMSQLRALVKKGWLVLPTNGRVHGAVVPELQEEIKTLAATMERAAREMKTRPRKSGKPIKRGEAPTQLQGRMYRLLLKFMATHGYVPSLRELMDLAEATSTAVVVAHLKSLHKRGFVVILKRQPDAEGKVRRQARNLEVPKISEATRTSAARMLAELK